MSVVEAKIQTVEERYRLIWRDELEAPLGELVVSGRRQMAPRADCGRTFAR
jgi:hypothetical protein